MSLWKQYWHRKQELIESHHANNIKVQPLQPAAETEAVGVELQRLSQGKLLDRSLNENYLFHGTDYSVHTEWPLRLAHLSCQALPSDLSHVRH